jgi:exosortase B
MLEVLGTKAFRHSVGFEWLPVVAGLLILYIPTFYDLAGTHWVRDDHAHGPIILAVFVWLIWYKRQMLLAEAPHTAPVAGTALLVFGLLFYVVGRAHGVVLFEVGALGPILAGTLLAMRGWPALRHSWFTLIFIAFLVPLPGSFVDALTLPMKQDVSAIATHVLYAVGYPVARSGVVLTIGQYQLLVADACAGLNSMFSLSAVGLLYLYLMHRESWLHNGLILASLLPIAFCANTVRVIILVLVTYHFGDAAGQGFVHGFSGLVLFVFALIAVFLLDTVVASFIKLRTRAK